MSNLKWHLFTLRTQIEIRLIQLGISFRRRTRLIKVLAGVNDIPRLTTFADKLETKEKQIP